MDLIYMVKIAFLIFFVWGWSQENAWSQMISTPINKIILTKEEKLLQAKMAAIEKCDSNDDFHFCVYPGEGMNAKKVLYFFYGIMGKESVWINNRTYLKIQTEWAENPNGRPTVITISYGRVYLLTPKSTKKLSGMLDQWSRKNIINFEKINLGFTPSSRYILGCSMGGHSALNLYIKHFPFFSKMGLLCPAQLLNSPFTAKKEVLEILPEIDSIWPMYIGAMGLLGLYYDSDSWNRLSPFNYDPQRLKQLKNIRMILMNEDLYGFTVVNKNWINYVNYLGGHAEFKTSSGIHCYPSETRYLSEFLVQ